MKKKIIIALRMLITLVLVAPVVLFALENAYIGRPVKAAPQELVKAWDIDRNIHGAKLRFSFRIHENGTVEGTVGNVAMQDAHLRRNRHWFSKLLGRRRDYRVKGRLESSPINEPREVFWIEFNLDTQGTMTRVKAGLHN
jgi:hypothetical protein